MNILYGFYCFKLIMEMSYVVLNYVIYKYARINLLRYFVFTYFYAYPFTKIRLISFFFFKDFSLGLN